MTLSLILAFIWVLAAAVTAMMPMRLQYIPGVTLLFLCLPMLFFVGYQNGWWVSALCLAGAVSMFRRPLIYFSRRALGLPASLPKELDGNER